MWDKDEKEEVIVLGSLLFLGFHQEDHPRVIKYEVLVSYLWSGSAQLSRSQWLGHNWDSIFSAKGRLSRGGPSTP